MFNMCQIKFNIFNFCVCVFYKIKMILYKMKKWRELTQLYDKSPHSHRNLKQTKWQHKTANKKVDYTAIADRLRTVSWNNYSHPTGVVNQFTGQTFPPHPTPATAV